MVACYGWSHRTPLSPEPTSLSPSKGRCLLRAQEAVAVQLIRQRPALFEERVLPLLRDYNCK